MNFNGDIEVIKDGEIYYLVIKVKDKDPIVVTVDKLPYTSKEYYIELITPGIVTVNINGEVITVNVSEK